MCLFQFWFPQGIHLGVGLLGHIVVLFLVFKGISILSSAVAVSIYIPTPSAPLLHGPRSPSALEGLLCPLVPGSGDPRQVLGPYYWEGPGEPGPCAHSAQPGLGAGSPSAGEGLSELRERRPGAGPGLRRQGQDRAGIHGWRGCPSRVGHVFRQISQCGEAQG